MDKLYFEVDIQKTHEVILYIAQRVDQPTLHTICKLMYFADKLHLEAYGRFITGNTYIAMEYGPVPSEAYDYLKGVRRAGQDDDIEMRRYYVVPRRDPDLGQLSESDVECLDEALREYGELSFGQLTDASHDEAWQRTLPNRAISLENIIASMDQPDDLLAHLRDQHPGSAAE